MRKQYHGLLKEIIIFLLYIIPKKLQRVLTVLLLIHGDQWVTKALPEDQFIPFQVNKKIMELADKNAIYIVYLPK